MKIRLTVRNPTCLNRVEVAPSRFQLPQAELKWDLDEKSPQTGWMIEMLQVSVSGLKSFPPISPSFWNNESGRAHCSLGASGVPLSYYCRPLPVSSSSDASPVKFTRVHLSTFLYPDTIMDFFFFQGGGGYKLH